MMVKKAISIPDTIPGFSTGVVTGTEVHSMKRCPQRGPEWVSLSYENKKGLTEETTLKYSRHQKVRTTSKPRASATNKLGFMHDTRDLCAENQLLVQGRMTNS